MPANNDVHDSSGVAPAHQSNVSFSSQSTALTSNETDTSNRPSDDQVRIHTPPANIVSRLPSQLESLTALLERENRIKEGAEKFLKLPITVRRGRVSQPMALKFIL